MSKKDESKCGEWGKTKKGTGLRRKVNKAVRRNSKAALKKEQN